MQARLHDEQIEARESSSKAVNRGDSSWWVAVRALPQPLSHPFIILPGLCLHVKQMMHVQPAAASLADHLLIVQIGNDHQITFDVY